MAESLQKITDQVYFQTSMAMTAGGRIAKILSLNDYARILVWIFSS